DAQASSAQAEAPGPLPSSDCDETTCNELLQSTTYKIINHEIIPQAYQRKIKIYNTNIPTADIHPPRKLPAN
ncbi:MAG: hypothetical protein ACK55Z_19190, partial [bacterium]